MRGISAIGAALCLALASPRLSAQFSYPEDRARQGDRVRLGVASEVTRAPRMLKTRPVIGILRTIAADTVYLELETSRIAAVPRIFILRSERSLGPPSRRESAGQIAMVGAVLGLIIPPVLPKRTGAFVRGPDDGMIIGGSVGLAVGAIVGFLFPFERWTAAWIPER